MHRLTRPLAAAAIVLAGVPALSASGAPSSDDLGACRAKGQIHVRPDEWTEIKAPKMDPGEGAQSIVDYAAPPYTHSRLYMTNGTVIKESADAGCTWYLMPNTAELDKLTTKGTQQDVYTVLDAPKSGELWAASYDSVSGVEHPHVYVAAGLTDTTLTSPEFIDTPGLPPAGRPVALVGSPTQPALEFAIIEGPAPDPASGDVSTPARHLYVTFTPHVDSPQDPVPPVDSPRGFQWKEVLLPSGFSHFQGVQTPTEGNAAWIWSGTSYAYTSDILATKVEWTTVTAPGKVTAIDARDDGTMHVVYATEQGGVDRVYEDGKYTDYGLPTAGLYAHGSYKHVAAVSGPTGVFGYDTRVKSWVRITAKGVPAFTKMTMPYGRVGRVVMGLAGGTLYRYDTYLGELFLQPPPLPDGAGDWPTIPGTRLKYPVLTPIKEVVNVTPGELRTVPVKFQVPPAPNPLDVYFLLDTTGSMQPAMDSLRANIGNIAARLRKALGKDACFGLGDFHDYVVPGDPNHNYVRDVPVTCDHPVEKIRAFMAGMPPAAFGGDFPEAQTIALSQAVKGDGQQLPNPPVDRGQQAGFRANSYKVIVMISDSSFRQGAGYPTKTTAINTLNNAYVKPVSVLVGTGQPESWHQDALRDMTELEQGTSTFAPSTVDCDGDRRQSPGDLPPGAPLVCDVPGGGDLDIGPAIVSLLLGVIDPGTLAVGVQDSDKAITGTIKGHTSKVVNLKRENGLAFSMPVSCSKAQDGQDLPIGLLPTVRALPVVIHGRVLYGEVIVRCRSIPPPPPPQPPKPEPEIPIFHPVRPQPVALVQPPGPAQPITNMNMNAGFSQQEEQQFQLAAVSQGASDQQEDVEGVEELAMSDYRARNDAYAGGYLLGSVAILSTAAALAYRRRLQRSTRVRTVRF